MAQTFGIEVTTVREGVHQRLARLRTQQDHSTLRPRIRAIDAAIRAPRDRDGSLHIHPMDTLAPAARPLEWRA